MTISKVVGKMTAKRMYAQRIASLSIDKEAFQTKIAESLLNDAPFEPVFNVDDRKVRIDKIAVSEGGLTVHLVPAS